MRTIPLAVAVAAAVACSPRFPAAQEVPARWGAYSVQAVDEGGRPLPTFSHRGRTHVLGALGQRLLCFASATSPGRRVEVVDVGGRPRRRWMGRPASLRPARLRRPAAVRRLHHRRVPGERGRRGGVQVLERLPGPTLRGRATRGTWGSWASRCSAERRYVPPPQAYQSPSHDGAPGARSSAAPEPGVGERKAEAPAAPRTSGRCRRGRAAPAGAATPRARDRVR